MSLTFNSRYRRFVLKAMKHGLQAWARITGRRFACEAMSGQVRDGIFVNSDMTVSCNCQDVDGTGQLGNLRQSAFETIFTGSTATRLRHELAAGRLPVTRCSACFHRRMVSRAEAEARRDEFQLPPGLGVENTALCNLRCTGCCREELMATRKNGRFLRGNDIEIVSRALAGLKATYCGYYNLGEPFFSRSIRHELATLRQHNPEIEILISTNGLLLNTDEKREAALLADHVLFSIDGIDTPMVGRYQRGGDFEKAYENLKKLVAFRNERGATRPCIYWKYVVFRWNDRPTTIRRAIELGREAGVDCLQFTFARNPLAGVSWRYLLSPFFRGLGVPQGWRIRNVWLTEPVTIGDYRRPVVESDAMRVA